MPSVLVRTMLFLSSYFPLALIFFFLFIQQQPAWAIAILAIGVMGLVIMLLYFFYFAQRFAPIQEKITGLHGRDAEPMSYIASYLIPFIALPFSGWQQVTALLILIASAMLLHGVVLHPIAKTVLLTAVAAVGSFATSAFVLRKSPLRAIV